MSNQNIQYDADMNTENYFQLSLKNLSRCDDKTSYDCDVSTAKNRLASMPNLQTLRKQPTTPGDNVDEPYLYENLTQESIPMKGVNLD